MVDIADDDVPPVGVHGVSRLRDALKEGGGQAGEGFVRAVLGTQADLGELIGADAAVGLPDMPAVVGGGLEPPDQVPGPWRM